MTVIIISVLGFTGSGYIGAEAPQKQKRLREENPSEFKALDEASEFAKTLLHKNGQSSTALAFKLISTRHLNPAYI